MRLGLYARVSTDVQEARGSIGSQLEVLREWAAREGHQIVAEYKDDGYSGAHLNRPGLDALRDAAEQGFIEGVLCLTPDRLARAYAYQYLVLEEFERHQVPVLFTDAPALDSDPQVRLLTQMQGVIAEYERAKIAERNRRGRLFRARAGEPVSWKVPYGYRRIARTPSVPAHLEVFEPEATIVRRIYDDYVAGDHSVRQICWRLHEAGIPTATGKLVWRHCTVARILHNPVYVGTLYCNREEWLPARVGEKRSTRKRLRPPEQWIAIPVPAIVSREVFDAAQKVSHVHWKFSRRRADPGHWLLRGLVRCGHCGVVCTCVGNRSSVNVLRYYTCPHRDALRAGGQDKRCRAPNIRADRLDDFVFEQVREALLRPEVLVSGEHALAARTPALDDELLAKQLTQLGRRLDSADDERRRLVDIFQAGLIDRTDLERRLQPIDERRQQLVVELDSLRAQRHELVHENRLRGRVAKFAEAVSQGLDELDFEQRQRLMRLLLEEVRVTDWQVQIKLRIPLDDNPGPDRGGPPGDSPSSGPDRLSSNDGLRLVRAGLGAVDAATGGVEADAADRALPVGDTECCYSVTHIVTYGSTIQSEPELGPGAG